MLAPLRSTMSFAARPIRLQPKCVEQSSIYLCHAIRSQSTDSAPPALLTRLRGDLKTAMRNKDKDRLNVVKGILNEVTNAAKTSSPITTDMQFLSLLRKRVTASEMAINEFAAAGRMDLQERENSELAILNQYAGHIEVMDESQVEPIVAAAIDSAKNGGTKISMGDVLKQLLGPGGELENQPVEKSLVARLVKQKMIPS